MTLSLADIGVMHNAVQVLENLSNTNHPAATHCHDVARELRRLVLREFVEVERGIQASDAAGLEHGKTGG